MRNYLPLARQIITIQRVLNTVAALLFVTVFMPSAFAHYVWIEQGAVGNARLYFGEFENGLKEKSPGKLDDIKTPIVMMERTGGASPIDAKRTETGFDLSARATDKNALTATVNSMGVKDWRSHGVGIVKPIFYARHAVNESAVMPQMAFDVTPTGTAGQFIVTLNGKPLAKTKVDIFAPNGWGRDAKTDTAGIVTFAMPWRGQYVLEVTHKEEVAGEFEGVKYEALRHRVTLTIMQKKGLTTFAPQTASMLQMP